MSRRDDNITTHPDGVLVLGESMTFYDEHGHALTAAVRRDGTGPAAVRVTVSVEGGSLDLSPRTARSLATALTGIANTADIVDCLHV
ncbi:hypothetical protein [Luteipulveratus halotolerans]|uniref:Uncharacterized protein n=1 Tax=Luteipulveratus halotolerans TaxID=1631356 RepID=A0A0L6CE37_9MICO|nr:hypothetical protein [Luteipulveratus halotolerans]KNX35865.1 hypothetical protein VV01_21555 [Luteipulveratus halotolerans]